MLGLKDMAAIVAEHGEALYVALSPIKLTDEFTIADGRPALMGVVNLSPDSWYRESVCLSVDAAVQRGRVLSELGASVVDIGAESTLGQAELVYRKHRIKFKCLFRAVRFSDAVPSY